MEITASYLTLAAAPYGQPAKYGMLERAKAAHAVGIPSIGVSLDEEFDERALRYVRIPEAEWLELSVPLSTEGRYKLRALRNYFGVSRVNAGVTAKGISTATAADNLRRLLDILPSGMTVAVEPVAFGAVSTISGVEEVLELSGADASDAGLLYDWWQTSYDPRNLFANPGEILPVIAEVQLCGFREDDPETEDPAVTSQDRNSLSWESRRSIRWLRDQLITMAPGVPFSYELPNAHLRELPLMEIAEIAAKDMSLIG